MNNDTTQKIEHAFGWISQLAILGLLSVAVYFIKDLHSDFKTTQHRVENHEVRISIVESKMK